MNKSNYNRYRVSLELHEILDAMKPREFEEFIGELFQQMGYDISITSLSADEGVDLFLEKEGRKVIVQCKRYKGSVGQPVVRDFFGTMVHNQVDQGFIVTTGTFSLPAQTWVEGKPIHLVDGAGLLDWIKSFSFPSVLELLPAEVVLRLASQDTVETVKPPPTPPAAKRKPKSRRPRRRLIGNEGVLGCIIPWLIFLALMLLLGFGPQIWMFLQWLKTW